MNSFDKRALWAAIGLYFVLTALLIVRVPLGAAPDESAHWQYIEFVATTGNLPVFEGQAPPAPGYEFHQPPLYYLLAAPLWKILPPGVEQYAARFVSLLCGLLTVALVWASARKIWPNRPEFAAVAAFFVALWPLHQSVGAVSGNDALAGLICAALFFVGTRARIEGVTRRDALAVGVLAGLGLLTKTTTLVVSLAAILALLTSQQAEHTDKPTTPFRAAFTAALICLVVAAPILLRNTSLYGDPLALGAFSGAATAGTPGFPLFSQAGLDAFTYWRGISWMVLISAWGFYGGPDSASKLTSPLSPDGPRLPDVYLLPLLAICVLAPLFALWGWKKLDDEFKSQFSRVARFFAAGALLVVLAWIQFSYGHFSGGQARYLHPALLPVAIFLAAGWLGALGRGRKFLFASLAFGAVLLLLTGLNLFVWRTLV